MNTERRHKLGFTPFTREYIAGIIAGAGGVLVVSQASDFPHRWYLPAVGWLLLAAGGIWQNAMQKRLQRKTGESAAA